MAYGRGKIVEADGMVYIGNFKLDKKSGFGRQKDMSGNSYKGEFLNNK